MSRSPRWARYLLGAAVVALVAAGCVPSSPQSTGGAAPASAPAPTGPQITCGQSSFPQTSTPATSALAQEAGIATGGGIIWENDSDFNCDMAAIGGLGVSWIRFDLYWQAIEPYAPTSPNHQWRWGQFDRIVSAAHARGIKIVATLSQTPNWAEPAGCPGNSNWCLPGNVAAYANFAAQAASRYGANASDPNLRGSIEDWEIWNEPNHQPFSLPSPNPSVYASMLKAVYPALKAVDPSATVITGGTSPDSTNGVNYSPTDWLAALYANGAGGSFDAVGHHPYAFGCYPNGQGGYAQTNPLDGLSWNPLAQVSTTQKYVNGVLTTIPGIRQLMVANGDGNKKIWATEAGAPTGTDPCMSLSETQQAQWIENYFQAWTSPSGFGQFTGPMMVFQARDLATNSASYGSNFGLITSDGSWRQKPSYGTYRNMLATGSDTAAVLTAAAVPAAAVAPVDGERVAANPNGGYYVLSSAGVVYSYGAPNYGSPNFGWNIARGIAVMPDGLGYAVLDGWGGVHTYGSATALNALAPTTYWPGWDIARDIAISPNGQGYTVLDGFGGVHPAGDAPVYPNLGYWPGWDIARAFAYDANGGAYLLDGFGGVHVGGPAHLYRTDYFGFDIARDIAVNPDGSGYVVLDGWGAVHPGGNVTLPIGNPAYAPVDAWRSVALTTTGYILTR